MSRKQTIYLESSVISYYANDFSNDLKVATEQKITKEWWDASLSKFDPYVSVFVIEEVSRGRKKDAERRLKVASAFILLEEKPALHSLAKDYIKKLSLPKTGEIDAYHLAFAAIHEVDFLVSWNCKHIANALKFSAIRKINEAHGFPFPTICTPRELSEG